MSRKANPTIPAAMFKRLQGLRAPCWLIDLAQNQIVWINAAGRKRLNPAAGADILDNGGGVQKQQTTRQSDPVKSNRCADHRRFATADLTADGRLNHAMPALRQLKQLQHSFLHSGTDKRGGSIPDKQIQSLLFWTPGGELHLSCAIEFAPAPADQLVLIVAQEEQQTKLRNLSRRNHAQRTISPMARLVAAEQFPRPGRLYADLYQPNKAPANIPANNNVPDTVLPSAPTTTASYSAPPVMQSAQSAQSAQPAQSVTLPADAVSADAGVGAAKAAREKVARSKSADAETLQEIAKRIRQTPLGSAASPFSLEALHAAASDGTIAPDGQTASGCRRSPTIISFRRAARAQADKLNAAAVAVSRPDHTSAFAATKAPLPDMASNLKPRAAATRSPAPSLTVPELASSTEASVEPVAANIVDISATGVSRTDAARLAHELRTPLSAIQSAAELLAAEQFGPIGNTRYKEYAQDIGQAAAHTLSVIDAMLDADYLATGTPPTKPTTFDLHALIKASVSAFRPLAAAKTITLATELAQDVPPLYADARAVRQILLNLLTNALKFTPAGGAITVATGIDSDGAIWLSICDTGPGMSDDQISAIMRGAVMRGRNIQENTLSHNGTVDNAPSGHGFGLPMIFTLAKANGARVELASAVPGGLNASVIFFASNRPKTS